MNTILRSIPWVAAPLPAFVVARQKLPLPAKVVIAWLLGYAVLMLATHALD